MSILFAIGIFGAGLVAGGFLMTLFIRNAIYSMMLR